MQQLQKSQQEGRLVYYDGCILPKFKILLPDPTKHMEAIRNFESRTSDILLCSYPKSGSNWTYEIVKMLLRGTSEYDSKSKGAAMMEAIEIEKLERLQVPRFLNTHLPFRHIPKKHVENGCKIIRVLRNPKDVMVSYYNHLKYFPISKPSDGFPESWEDFFKEQLQNNHSQYDGFFKDELGWEEAIRTKKVKHVFLAFYENLIKNPVEEIGRLANFLEVEPSDKLVQEIADKCSFQKLSKSFHIKEERTLKLTKDGTYFVFRKGIIGDWKNWFTVAQNEQYDDLIAKEMKTSSLKFIYEI